MTALHVSRPVAAPAAATVAVCAAGTALLLGRPWLAAVPGDPTLMLIVVFASLAAAGAWWPLPAAESSGRARAGVVALVAVVGVGAFALGRMLAGGRGAVPASVEWAALNVFAAVCEEVFFRRLVYGVLRPHGAGLAVVGSAALFAVVHLTVWGAWVLPVDLAAGLVLSWQRWATGRWSVPAVTHGFANLLALSWS